MFLLSCKTSTLKKFIFAFVMEDARGYYCYLVLSLLTLWLLKWWSWTWPGMEEGNSRQKITIPYLRNYIYVTEMIQGDTANGRMTAQQELACVVKCYNMLLLYTGTVCWRTGLFSWKTKAWLVGVSLQRAFHEARQGGYRLCCSNLGIPIDTVFIQLFWACCCLEDFLGKPIYHFLHRDRETSFVPFLQKQSRPLYKRERIRGSQKSFPL